MVDEVVLADVDVPAEVSLDFCWVTLMTTALFIRNIAGDSIDGPHMLFS